MAMMWTVIRTTTDRITVAAETEDEAITTAMESERWLWYGDGDWVEPEYKAFAQHSEAYDD